MDIVGVVGSHQCESRIETAAEEVGKLLAQHQFVVLTGGRGGVMEAASRGAKQAGGLTLGILPGEDKSAGNPYIDIAIVTALHDARNAVIVRTADILIAISGGYGTLSEIALALKIGKHVIGLHTWPDIPGVVVVATPAQAVQKVLKHFGKD